MIEFTPDSSHPPLVVRVQPGRVLRCATCGGPVIAHGSRVECATCVRWRGVQTTYHAARWIIRNLEKQRN